jgi:D-alanyl-lipoteichoic acid acyltransferase DltB (MBOAT superfamily)
VTRRRLLGQRLAALFVAGLLLFDFPLLGLWQGSVWAVFVAWALLIAALAWLLERGD